MCGNRNQASLPRTRNGPPILQKNTGTIVYTVRQGIHFALDSTSPASRQVNGRELNADDVVTYLKRAVSESTAYLYRVNLPLRSANVTKSGPWEVTVTVPLDAMITAIFRFGCSFIGPAELSTAVMTKRENPSAAGVYLHRICPGQFDDLAAE